MSPIVKQTNALIVGASVSGLASASCLQKQGIEYIIIEKHGQVAMPWHNHYDRLHLHTNKSSSNLPYKKFADTIPRYPSRQQVVDYLSEYQKEFNINPIFNTEAKSVKQEDTYWTTETTNGTFKSKYLILATGPYGKPKTINFKGMETFSGKILHSYGYKTGSDFRGQNVLVVGFGNSACEIAIDLYEQGAIPSMSVRSPVNVIPRDVFGIPVLQLSLFMNHLPPKVADAINAPLVRLLIGDITRLGLKKLPYGPLEQIQRDGRIPLLDIGTIRHIREGHIKICYNVDFITGKTIQYIQLCQVRSLPAIKFNQEYEIGQKNLYFCNYNVIIKTKHMQISVIDIGNSKGIRLTKNLLEKYDIRDKVELILEKGRIILKPVSKPRQGWEKSFQEMHANGDDKLLIDDIFNDENLEEWK